MPLLLRNTDSLDAHWEDCVYSEARLLAADHKPQAQAMGKMLKRLEGIHAGQRAAWRREIVAQAQVDASDDALDDQVDTFSRDLLYIEKGNRKSARYKQYFKSAVSAIVRLGLESQIPVVRTMVSSLVQEPEKQLKTHAKALESILAKGETSVGERRDAASARGAHRAREIMSFVDDLNAARTSIHAELALHASKATLPRDYADRFFRRSSKTPRAAEPDAAEPTPSL